MRVSELLELLKNCPSDAPIVVYDRYGNRCVVGAYGVVKCDAENAPRIDDQGTKLPSGTIYVELH